MFLVLLACNSDAVTGPARDRGDDEVRLPRDAVDTGTGADDVTEDVVAETDDAVLVSATFPAAMECGAADAVVNVLQNTGTTTWRRGARYRLGAVDDADPLNGAGRVEMDVAEVAPGEQATFVVPLTGPGAADTLLSDWRMLQEGVAWFGETSTHTVTVSCAEETGGWVCEGGARNGDEVCDDEGFYAPSRGTRVALYCAEATGGVAYISTNTGPACSDGVHRCQGWEAAGQDAWDYLDYVVSMTCHRPGDLTEIDLSRYEGGVLYVGAHTQDNGDGRMTTGCLAYWQE